MKRRRKKTGAGARSGRNGAAAAVAKAATGGLARVTIKDVAAAAGVSPMTVSNVINGNFRFVSESTRKIVEREIRRLNYRVLTSGRSLRLGRRNCVGVILVDEFPDFLAHPFISRVVSGLCNFLSRNDYSMIVQGVRPDEFRDVIALKKAEADAYCVRLHGQESARQAMLDVLGNVREPLALVQETLAPVGPDSCVVRQDDYGGGIMIADHLAARGVKRLAVVVPKFSGPMVAARVKGLEDGFRAAGMAVRVHVLATPFNNFPSAYETIARYLDAKERPDAIFGTNDQFAIAALRVLQERRIKVPDEVRVVGFNGFQPPEFTRPSLTTVVSRASDIGETAGRMLLARLGGSDFTVRDCVLPVSLRKGAST